MGVPYLAVRGLLGSDILSYRDDFLVQENPFNVGEQTVLVQSIRPDVAVFHALKADKFGNAITPGRRDDAMMARAASTVIVTTEEVTEDRLKETDAISRTFINGLDVAALAHVPLGAHPCGCGTLYDLDEIHFAKYIQAARSDQTFSSYLKEYIYDLDSHEEYLAKVDSSANSLQLA